MFLERKVGVTERPRSLYPGEAAAMAIFPIIVYFSNKHARSSMTWPEFVCAVRMRSNNWRECP